MALVGCAAAGGTESTDAGGDAAGLCADGTLAIGMAKAKTGSFAAFDKVGGQAIEVAVDQINADGGINGCEIALTWSDTKSDPAVGGQVAQQLIDDGAQLLIVPADFDAGAPASLAAQSAGLFAMSPEAGSVDWPVASGPNFAIAGLTSAQIGTASAIFAGDKEWGSAYVVTDSAFDFFKGIDAAFTKRFEADGGTIAGTLTVAPDTSDYSAAVSRIKSASPDVVLLNDFFPNAATFIKQLRSAGVEAPVLGNQTFASPQLTEALGEGNLTDVYYALSSFYEGPTAVPDVLAFVEAYEEKFGTFPENNNAIAAWEGVKLLQAALEEADTTEATAVMAALQAQSDVEVGGAEVYSWSDGVTNRRIAISGFDASGEPVEVAQIDPAG
jgi:branched-chain amino acid transport system substrate-binding protein